MTLVSLTDCCRLLVIDPKTLRRWLSDCGLSTQPHPLDARCKCVTREQLQQLAAVHRRALADYELRFAVNYLAPFLLTHLLLPCLRRAAPARIVNVASGAQSPINFGDVMLERHYDPMRAYSQSKLALVMFTFDLAEALREEQITVNCLHPASLMNTKMVSEYFGYTLSTVQDGVDSVMYLATSPKLEGVTGKYFEQKQEAQANRQAYDREARRKLRQLSEALTGLQVAHEEKR